MRQAQTDRAGADPELGEDPFAGLLAGQFDSDQRIRLLAGVLNALPIAVAVIATTPGHPYVYANPVYETWVGAPPGSLAGRSRTDVRLSGHQEGFLALVAEVIATGEPRHLRNLPVSGLDSGQVPLAVEGGLTRWNCDLHPLRGADGRVEHILQTAVDVTVDAAAGDQLRRTHEREMDELRAHAERMAALDKLKSDFLSLATHELRSPLAIVNGYLSMLDSGVAGELSPTVQRMIDPVVRNVAVMAELVNELLETARLDEGQTQLATEPVNVRALLEEATVTMRRTPDHRLRADLGAGPGSVLGDPAQLQRVFANLLDNAVKYSPDGGDVTVTMHTSDAEVTVTVSDQGLGIAAADQHRLFTRFGRIVTDETRAISGTGLGLYLCREIARRHGGDVTATSHKGHGSRFTVRLPRLVAPVATQGASAG